MATPALIGQNINYKDQNVPLQYDQRKGEYYFTVDGVRYEVDWNCIHNSKIADVKQDIQEQVAFHQKWINHYQDMIAWAKDNYTEATDAIKKAKNDIIALMCFAGADDYKNLDSKQQKEYLTYQQQISDNKGIKRRSSSEIMFASHQAISELYYQQTCNYQSAMCDKLMA